MKKITNYYNFIKLFISLCYGKMEYGEEVFRIPPIDAYKTAKFIWLED